MRKPRKHHSFVPGKHKPLRMGPPRVVEDCELYEIVALFADDGIGRSSAQEMAAHVQSWCAPWATWQLGHIALRARLFLGCIRKELGRRDGLDPNQLRLRKGL